MCLITTAPASGKRAGDRQRTVQIHQVVVGQLLAVELAGADQIGTARAAVGIQRRLLMRVLAVAQNGLALQ